VGRTEKRLFAIADQLQVLAGEEQQLQTELDHHRDMADDIERDAAISDGQFDRLEAGLARADVSRFQKRLDEIRRRRAKLEATRTRLLSKLNT